MNLYWYQPNYPRNVTHTYHMSHSHAVMQVIEDDTVDEIKLVGVITLAKQMTLANVPRWSNADLLLRI